VSLQSQHRNTNTVKEQCKYATIKHKKGQSKSNMAGVGKEKQYK
jgi:hypothetical protein